jgi:hypothetical protein
MIVVIATRGRGGELQWYARIRPPREDRRIVVILFPDGGNIGWVSEEDPCHRLREQTGRGVTGLVLPGIFWRCIEMHHRGRGSACLASHRPPDLRERGQL